MNSAPPVPRIRRRASTALLVFAMVPLALLDGAAVPANPVASGGAIAGRAWLLLLPVTAAALLLRPVSGTALRDFAPYGLFLLLATASVAWAPDTGKAVGTLLRLAAAALVYLAVRNRPTDDGQARAAATMSVWWIVVAGAALVASGVVSRYDFPERLTAMSVAALLVAALLVPRSRRATLALGGGALALSALTGSRTASLVILILLLVAPSLGMSWRLRTAIAVAALVAFGAALSFPALQERWFTEGDDGSLVDVVTFNSNFDTSGRTTVWSALWTDCRARPLLGRGLGSANVAGAAVDKGFGQPHNEYLRVFCDTGIAGSVLLWGFFAGVGWRAVAVTRVPGAPRAAAAAALLLLLGMALFAATDNVLTATLQYAAPAAVVFAWSDRAHAACAPRRSLHGRVLERR